MTLKVPTADELAEMFRQVAEDMKREDEREQTARQIRREDDEAAEAQASIYDRGSPRWTEVMDSERGPDIDFDEGEV